MLSEDADDQSYGKLLTLKAAINRFLKDAAAELPSLRTFVPNETMPALMVSYLLYGNVDREFDIIDRNKIPNAAFVIGSEPLEVLIK